MGPLRFELPTFKGLIFPLPEPCGGGGGGPRVACESGSLHFAQACSKTVSNVELVSETASLRST